MVTRPRRGVRELADRLEDRGARVLSAPAIVSEPDRMAAARWKRFLTQGRVDWVVFTSRSGVEALLGRAGGLRQRRGVPGGNAHVAAVGEGTARALEDLGVTPDLVPPAYTTAALGRAFPRGRGAVLIVRADIAPAGLEDAIAAKGWTPTRANVYTTAFAPNLPRTVLLALDQGRADALTFTSASTVDAFTRLAGARLRKAPRVPKVICIGPVTAATARKRGLRVAAVARPHTIEGLVEAVERAFRPRRPAGKEN